MGPTLGVRNNGIPRSQRSDRRRVADRRSRLNESPTKGSPKDRTATRATKGRFLVDIRVRCSPISPNGFDLRLTRPEGGDSRDSAGRARSERRDVAPRREHSAWLMLSRIEWRSEIAFRWTSRRCSSTRTLPPGRNPSATLRSMRNRGVSDVSRRSHLCCKGGIFAAPNHRRDGLVTAESRRSHGGVIFFYSFALISMSLLALTSWAFSKLISRCKYCLSPRSSGKPSETQRTEIPGGVAEATRYERCKLSPRKKERKKKRRKKKIVERAGFFFPLFSSLEHYLYLSNNPIAGIIYSSIRYRITSGHEAAPPPPPPPPLLLIQLTRDFA